jgi:hypothetical protein
MHPRGFSSLKKPLDKAAANSLSDGLNILRYLVFVNMEHNPKIRDWFLTPFIFPVVRREKLFFMPGFAFRTAFFQRAGAYGSYGSL